MQNRILDESVLSERFYTDLTQNEVNTLLTFLFDIQRSKGGGSFLEIGVNGGGNIRFLKSYAPHIRYTGIDMFEDFQPADDNTHVSGTFTMAAVQRSVGEDVRLYKGDSAAIVPELNETFDFIFIDGNHSYLATKIDFQNSLRILAPGGYLGFHNCSSWGNPDIMYNSQDGGPWKVTQEIKRMPEFHLEADIDRVRVFSRK